VVFEDLGKLYVVDAGGWITQPLTTGMPDNWEPSWSGDGQWILFEGDQSYGGESALYVVHPDGSGLRAILNSGGARFPSWGPGDSLVAFLVRLPADSVSFPRAAVTMDLSGARRDTVKVWSSSCAVDAPAWSPDGSAITFLDGCPGVWSIGELSLAAASYSIVANAQGNHPGAWSAAGTSFVYGTGDLWMMDASGAHQHQILANGHLNMDPSWAPISPVPTARRSH
jgi:Tol biopolymer transport system component